MPLPRPSLVIFDMDGTTVRHLNPLILHALEIADDAMYKSRLCITKMGQKLGYGTRFRTRRSKRKPRLLVHRTLHKLRRKSVEQIVAPCPGIIDLLELFAAHHIPVGLISNGLGKGYGHDILKAFTLDHLYAATIFREDTTRAKPDPEPIINVIQKTGLTLTSHDTIWYVGDRAKDVAAALRAMPFTDATVIPIGYGLHVADMLFANNYSRDHLVYSYEDWYPVVEDILQGTVENINANMGP
jgi:phosphoglycolate phosphatase